MPFADFLLKLTLKTQSPNLLEAASWVHLFIIKVIKVNIKIACKK